MKTSGRKNDGAWYRTNRAIKNLNVDDKASFVSALKESVGLKGAAVFTDLGSLAAECGITWPPTGIATTDDWLTQLASIGIPRQIWQGRLSFTTSAVVSGTPATHDVKYRQNYQSNVHYFAKDLRRFCKYWFFGRREISDLMNVEMDAHINPGGRADATKTIAGI